MADYKIRGARPGDKEVVKAIYKQEQEHIGSFNLYQVWDNFIARKGSNRFIVVEGAGGVVAMCNYSYSNRKDCYVINDVCVLAEYKGNGIGRLILESIKNKAHREGVHLMLKCNCDNTQGNAFYEKCGMRLNGINYTRSKGVKQNVWII
jgi:GNAT superfamily N-acetyltransferase